MFQAALRLIITLVVILIPVGVTTYYILDSTNTVKANQYFRTGFSVSPSEVTKLIGDGTSLGARDFWVTFASSNKVVPKDFDHYKRASCSDLIAWFSATLESYETGFVKMYDLKQELSILSTEKIRECYSKRYTKLGYTSENWLLIANDQFFFRSWEYN